MIPPAREVQLPAQLRPSDHRESDVVDNRRQHLIQRPKGKELALHFAGCHKEKAEQCTTQPYLYGGLASPHVRLRATSHLGRPNKSKGESRGAIQEIHLLQLEEAALDNRVR